MARSFVAVVLSLLLIAPAPLLSKDDEKPDLTKIIRVIGRFGLGQACPIAPRIAITAAHVPAVQPFAANVPLYGSRFEPIAGPAGVVDAVATSDKADLGVFRVDRDIRYYPVAKEAPKPGETLWWVGYDWSNQKDAMRPVHFEARVSRVIAGHIFFEESTLEGSSGSCVVNAAGEVVGVIAFGIPVGSPVRMDNGLLSQDEITGAVGVWGPWLPSIAYLEKQIAPPVVTIITVPEERQP